MLVAIPCKWRILLGVNNGWSLYGGGIGAENYASAAIGIGRDLMVFGALSFDITHARAFN